MPITAPVTALTWNDGTDGRWMVVSEPADIAIEAPEATFLTLSSLAPVNRHKGEELKTTYSACMSLSFILPPPSHPSS